MSKQREYQLRKIVEGFCRICTEPRVDANHCEKHAEQHRKRCRESKRRKYGYSPWRAGGKGRPPKDRGDA